MVMFHSSLYKIRYKSVRQSPRHTSIKLNERLVPKIPAVFKNISSISTIRGIADLSLIHI